MNSAPEAKSAVGQHGIGLLELAKPDLLLAAEYMGGDGSMKLAEAERIAGVFRILAGAAPPPDQIRMLTEDEVEACMFEVVGRGSRGGATMKEYEDNLAAAVQRAFMRINYGRTIQGK